MAPPIPITEDTPPDMLAGSMDLSVVLPSGHALKMSLERSTPMMDLLVQVTTANKMSPAGYIIQPLNEHGPLPYKPSTPIGALDAWTIRIVPKQNVHCTTDKKHLKMLNQPFEQTFRLQVHLPRNQLYVARVSPRTRLSDILLQVCSEKNLDPIKYSLRHPSNLDQVLKLSCTLQDYKLQEVTLVCNKSHPVEVSSVDIMSLQRDATNPAYRSTMCDEGSVSSGSLEGRSLSPAPSDGSSASPPPLPPSRPIRKRRPAPKPPALIKKISDEKLQNGVQSSTVIYHSRNSSDSSGYHEASVLSESPQNNSVTETLTRRKMASVSESKSMTDVTVIEPSLQQATSYNSITSLSSVPGRKKKTAAPPPPVPNSRTSSVTEDQQRTPSVSSTASSTTTLDGNEVKVAVKSATLPPSSRLNSVSSPPPSPSLAATVKPPSNTPQVDPAPRPRSKLLDSELHTQLTSILKDMPSSPKENFAPQPKPRKLLSTSQSFEENRDGIHNTQETSSPEETKSPKHLEFMNRKLHYSVFKTHKACIDELAFKFERTDSMIEIENTSTSEDPSESPVAVECQPPGNQTSHSQTTLVTESNTDSDADNSEIRMADEEIDRIFINATKSHSSHQLEEEQIMSLSSLPSPPSSLIQNESIQPPNNENLDWEYRLPAPPTFRDESKSPIVTEFGTITIGNLNDMLLPDTIKEDNVDKPEITSLKENGVQDNTDLNKTNNINKPLVETSRSSLVQEIIVEPTDPSLKENGVQDNTDLNKTNNINEPLVETSGSSLGQEIIVEPTDPGDQHIVIESVEQNVINELSNLIQRPNKSDTIDVESKCLSQEKSSSSTLDNFTITTYKDTKPVEVFEDESVKSSVGEKRDKSKDDAVFRAPKPRVKEPNLSRTSSFSMENKLNGPLIKRSMSYVSLLAANMPRHSQPYQALLGQQHWPPLRKTSSEINIDNKDGLPGESSFCQDNPAELQSVQVLRNILSQSHATLTPSPETESSIRSRDPSNSLQKSEDTVDSDVGSNKLRRSQSDEKPVEWNPTSKMLHTASLDEEYPRSLAQRGVPNINLSTWNERPKRQISIKHDADYTSGFGKKLVNQDEMSIDDQQNANVIIPIKLESPLKNLEQMEVKNLDKNFKLEGRSKSVSDLSRIPVVRAVEFKKPFATQSFDQSLLKPVHLVDNMRRNNVTQPETPTLLEQESNSDNTFIGVNSLARKFGAPQKRPVSVYGTSYSRIKNMQSDSKESTKPPKNTFDSKGDFSVVVAKKTNDKSEESDEAKTVEQHSNLKLNFVTSEIKAQARQSSGGFLGKESSLFTPSTQVTQADQIPGGSLTFDAPKNVETVSQVATNANIPAPLSPTQKVATTGIYRQSQTLNRQTRPISLQPVVKGFRVSTETPNSTRDKLSSFPPNAKDSKTMPIVINSVTNPVSSAQKKTYHRALSTPAISLSSVNIIDSAKERNQNKTSTVPSTPTSVTRDAIPAPPPPLLMHTLKPIGSRNVKLLPPPVAKPRDQLMLSIRSFNIDKLKPVSTQTKSSNSDKDLI